MEMETKTTETTAIGHTLSPALLRRGRPLERVHASSHFRPGLHALGCPGTQAFTSQPASRAPCFGTRPAHLALGSCVFFNPPLKTCDGLDRENRFAKKGALGILYIQMLICLSARSQLLGMARSLCLEIKFQNVQIEICAMKPDAGGPPSAW